MPSTNKHGPHQQVVPEDIEREHVSRRHGEARFSESESLDDIQIRNVSARGGTPGRIGRLGLAIATAPTRATNKQHAGEPDGDQVIGVERFAQAGDVRLVGSPGIVDPATSAGRRGPGRPWTR